MTEIFIVFRLRLRLSSIILFIERNNARPVRVSGRVGGHRVGCVEAVAGAFIPVLIPEIAALPDAMAQAGKGTDDDGVVSQHILRIMAGSVRLTRSLIVQHRLDACATGPFPKGDPPGRPYANCVLAVQEKPGPQVPIAFSPYAGFGSGV